MVMEAASVRTCEEQTQDSGPRREDGDLPIIVTSTENDMFAVAVAYK